MNVLIKSTKNLTNYYVHAYETWKKALSKFANVKYYGEGYPGFIGWNVDDQDVYKELNFIPDIELWCGGPGNPKPQYISDQFILKNPNKNIPKLILLCDYWEVMRDCSVSSWLKREEELSEMGVTGYFSFYSQSYPWMKKNVNTIFEKHIEFPYVYDECFSDFNEEKKWDINNQGAANFDYPFRLHVRKKLFDNNFNVFATTTTHHQYKLLNSDLDPLENIFHGGDPVSNFSKLLNSCWITITDGYSLYSRNRIAFGMEDSDLFLAKYPQTLASNSVLFCPEIKSDHISEIKDEYHYVKISPDNFMEKIKHYLNNKNELKKISSQANEWAKENCHPDIVGKRISKDLKDKIL